MSRSVRVLLHTLARVAVSVVLLSPLAGCGDGGAEPDHEQPMKTKPLTAKQKLIADLDKATNGEPVRLDATGLPKKPPRGFTAAQVDVLADQLLDVMERGISAEVATMRPGQAAAYVLKNQYPGTVRAIKQAGERVSGKYDWEFALASLFQAAPPTPSRVLKLHWSTASRPGRYGDGTPARILEASLRAMVRHDVVTGSGKTQPVVVMRTLTMTSYDPLGGPRFWAATAASVTAYGDDDCQAANDAQLRPSNDTVQLRRDLYDLKKALRDDDLDGPTTGSDPEDFQRSVKKRCG